MLKMTTGMLIAVFGLPGSGKSYFASHLSRKVNALYLSSDVLRKQLLSDPNYSPAEKERIYENLFSKASLAIENDHKVVLDATFHSEERRAELGRMCTRLKASLYWIEVVADEELIRKRVSRKRKNSDADFSVYQKIKAWFEPLKEDHLVLKSTNNNLEEMLAKALSYLQNE